MKSLADRIIFIREHVLHLRQEELAARLEVSRGAVGNWELGKGIKRDNLAKIAEMAGVSIDWLVSGRGDPPAQAPSHSAPPTRGEISAPIPRPSSPVRLIPIYGQAIGGKNGRFLMNGQKIADVFAPPHLEHVPDAYGVYVRGDSMEPRYFEGEGLWINPHLPVRQNDFVVVQIKDPEGGPPLGYVKRFVSRNETVLKLHQFNPPDGEEHEMRFPSGDVVAVHKIVGTF
jgi:phage repressor protein C with HTH and peptisase S24 domain